MNRPASCFSPTELAALLLGVAMLAAVAAPMITGSDPRTRRAGCHNNLRQLGVGYGSWAGENDGALPWNITIDHGGTKPRSGFKPAVAWPEFLALSNHLAAPRILACPQDQPAKQASDWTSGPRGFANSGFRGNALSYFLNFHAAADLPETVVSGDRDLRMSGYPASCSVGPLSNAHWIEGFDPRVAWTNAVHSEAGHLLRVDGSVTLQRNIIPRATETLASIVTSGVRNEVSRIHLAPPR